MERRNPNTFQQQEKDAGLHLFENLIQLNHAQMQQNERNKTKESFRIIRSLSRLKPKTEFEGKTDKSTVQRG